MQNLPFNNAFKVLYLTEILHVPSYDKGYAHIACTHIVCDIEVLYLHEMLYPPII